MNTAIAVFVKTPGVSPIKTRLASSAGPDVAGQFYKLSCDATASVLQGLIQFRFDIQPFWAVAESGRQEHQIWDEFSVVYQGEGDLGERLHTVYSQLRERFDNVILLGADGPQLSREEVYRVVETQRKRKGFVIGPSSDGGFWLLAGNLEVPKEVWTSVVYSSPETSQQLKEGLEQVGRVCLASQLSDVDEADDLHKLQKELAAQDYLSSEQMKLYRWLQAGA